MVTQQAAVNKFAQPVKKVNGDPCSVELLLFLGRHPYTQFSSLAIVHALNAWKADVEKAILRLEEKGLVKCYTRNGVSFYSLIGDRLPVSPMAKKPSMS